MIPVAKENNKRAVNDITPEPGSQLVFTLYKFFPNINKHHYN